MSDIIYLAGTDEQPSIYFDNSYLLRITGCSFPEDSWNVYKTVITRVSQLIDQRPGILNCEFMVSRCNKSSISCILDLFKLMRLMQYAGWQIMVKWQYQEFDEDMKDVGEEFSKILAGSFELVENEEVLA